MPIRLPFRILKYTVGEVITPFLGGFLFCMFVFLMFQVVRLADYFINHGVGLYLLAKITVFISAAFLPVVLPMAFLVAVIVGFGRMSADSEIVALKASGISLPQLYVPVAALSILLSAVLFWLNSYFIPWGNYNFKKTVLKLGNTKVVSNLREGTFTEGFFDLLVYADKVDANRNRIEGVFIYDERDWKNPMVVASKEGFLVPLKTESEFGSATVLRLINGSIHRTDLSRNFYEKVDFKEYRLLLKVEEADVGEVSYPKTILSPDLRRRMKDHKTDYAKYQEYATEYYKRIALSLTPLIFGILGVGLGVVRSRSVKSYAVFIGFGVVVFYWGLHVVGANLSEKGVLSPALAMQLSNLFVVPFALLSFKKSSW